jgi:hypothetical protein
MKILLEYFNAKVGRKDISETMTGNGSLHKTSTDTGLRKVNLNTQEKDCQEYIQYFHTERFINTLGHLMIKTYNQIDQVVIDRRQH